MHTSYYNKPLINPADVRVGISVRFVYPENSTNMTNTLKHLKLNKLYTVRNYTVIGFDLIMLHLDDIRECSFSSKQFVPEWCDYTVSCIDTKRIKYFFKRLRHNSRNQGSYSSL